jgi:hypothetical protein
MWQSTIVSMKTRFVQFGDKERSLHIRLDLIEAVEAITPEWEECFNDEPPKWAGSAISTTSETIYWSPLSPKEVLDIIAKEGK